MSQDPARQDVSERLRGTVSQASGSLIGVRLDGMGFWNFFWGVFQSIRPIEAACLTSTLRAKTRA